MYQSFLILFHVQGLVLEHLQNGEKNKNSLKNNNNNMQITND